MAGPLHNLRREAFCQHYAGDCWGNAAEAYRRAGYAPKSAETAGPRLTGFVEVETRIGELRTQRIKALGVDALWILERRRAIAEGSQMDGDRLRALDQLEKSLGLANPDRLVVRQEHTGQVALTHTASPDTLASLWSYIEEIRNAHLLAEQPGAVAPAVPDAVRADPPGQPV